MGMFSFLLRLDRLFQILNQRWEINRDGVAHALQIHIEVNMYQAVSHAHDIRPWNLRLRGASFVGHLCCSFTNDLDTLGERQGKNSVGPQNPELSSPLQT